MNFDSGGIFTSPEFYFKYECLLLSDAVSE